MRQFITLSLFSCLLALHTTSAIAETLDDNWSSVFKFQKRMAEIGNKKAQFVLGEMYEDGRGAQQDYLKAIDWYKKAQKSGHKKAASKISQVKAKIVAAKLNKEQAAKKAKQKAAQKLKIKAQKSKPVLKPRKKVSLKKTPPSKPIKVAPAKKIAKQKIEMEKELISKKKRPPGHSYDLNRNKGTHIDNFEDPFE